MRKRLARLDAAAPPHLGKRVNTAAELSLATMTIPEQNAFEALPEDDGLAREHAANALADEHVPGAEEWLLAFAESVLTWPAEWIDEALPRTAWTAVKIPEPPHVPAAAVAALRKDLAGLPDGPERDLHLTALAGLLLMDAYGRAVPATWR